jgi:hypothetical protein
MVLEPTPRLGQTAENLNTIHIKVVNRHHGQFCPTLYRLGYNLTNVDWGHLPPNNRP